MTPIFVTGPPRSGTSLVAGCLYKCGAWLPSADAIRGNDGNPKGYFENTRIRGINKAILWMYGFDPNGRVKVPHHAFDIAARDITDLVSGALGIDNYAPGPPFLIKDAKLCFLWPLWGRNYPDATWIVTKRDADDIAWSCTHSFMVDMQGKIQTRFEEWQATVKAYQVCANSLARKNKKNVITINTDALVQGDTAALAGAVEACGLLWNQGVVERFIDPSIWKRWARL